ncbi:hypothetical protein PILCRDRAFT_9457 [Piloderma croceum F 1598]|uniref:Integrase catalytic domain-containing protein n=1 Tax=Piloderma croceum (strain F 1598) TaxID=765440 RepID=A0A0C3FN23_PILCF|nr:hypothetical protein PILCRDRAFT_9457 [Piloderma croceum F 1598]
MAILDSPHPTEHPLVTTFKGDIFFAPVVNHLLGKTTGDSIAERRKAMHRAEGFMVEDNKLWRACIECSHCKGFGPAKLNALLQPIRRVKPFDLTAGDYVSLPTGKGGFKTLDYATPRAFMSDGGSHFKNGTVNEFCNDNNIQHIITPAYAPWTPLEDLEIAEAEECMMDDTVLESPSGT